MKKSLMFIILLITGMLFAQTSDLFFSEYIEGSSYNKALEIFNGTGVDVDLSNYQISQAVNGGGWEYYHSFPFGAIITNDDVWVITTDEAVTELQDVADEILAYPSVVHFNGNDARGLEWTPDGGTTWILLDVIGIPDEDPGDGWEVAGVPNATKEHTLVRKSTVADPTTDWALSAGTTPEDSQWEVYEQNNYDYIGYHIFPGTWIEDNTTPKPQVFLTNYPNPFNPSTTISFIVPEKISMVNISVYNIKGQKIKTLISEELTAGTHNIVWDGSNNSNKCVSSGIYFSVFDIKDEEGDFTCVKKMILMK